MKPHGERFGETSHTFSEVLAFLFKRFELRKNLQRQICDIARVIDAAMMRSLKRQTGKFERSLHAHRLGVMQARKFLLEINVIV